LRDSDGMRGLSPFIGFGGLLVVVPFALIKYVLSPEGQEQIPLVLLIVVGPFAAAGLAWLLYRAWLRRHYGE
jgi:hypothetical protein